MLISFEGIDGSGKSTQINLLKEYIEKKGQEVQVYREPGGVVISEQIRELLLNSKLEIHPVAEMLLFSAARSQLVAEKVIPDLKNGATVILDRFYDSTTAYQGFGRASVDLEQIHQINLIASLGHEPDITFYLRLDWEESKRRTAHLQEDRMEKAGEEFFKRVIKGFDHLAETMPRFSKIDANGSIEEIHEKIIKKLEAVT
jgi:dTMP kinase